jgi:hypothetical protein
MSRLDAEPQNQERVQRIEHEAGLLSKYSGWKNREHPEKEYMAYGLVKDDVPWLIEKLRDMHEENEGQLDRIRELGHKREIAVKALEWALDEISETDLAYAEDQKGEWACRVLATLKGGPA